MDSTEGKNDFQKSEMKGNLNILIWMNAEVEETKFKKLSNLTCRRNNTRV